MTAPLNIVADSVGNPLLRAQARVAIVEAALDEIRTPQATTQKQLSRQLLDRDIPDRLVDQVIVGAVSIIDDPKDGVPEADDLRTAAIKLLDLKAKQLDAETDAASA